MNKFKPISISLSPNVEKDDLKVAWNLLLRPWLWKKGKGIKELEESFRQYLGVRYAFSFNSGRSAFFAILKAMQEMGDLQKGDGVLLQAFTCNALVNPILWAELEPVYVDCNKVDFNIDVDDLKSKINLKTKIVIVQHTFGLPANMEAVRTLCAENNLVLIEDCAHSLGADYGGLKVGAPPRVDEQMRVEAGHSKAAFFSFSRDKIISSVYGGMAVTNDDELAKKLEQLQKEFGLPGYFWTLQQILHPILLSYIILPLYAFFDLGKLLLVFSQITHILSKAVSWKEKRGQRPDYFPKALPNGLAMMAFNQLSKVEKFNAHRQKIADYYYEQLKDTKFALPEKFGDRKNVFLRFTVLHKDAHIIIYEAWHNQNILLGDWYTTVIAPFDTKLEEMKYTPGSCPNAEWLAKRTLNLPTHINVSKKDAKRVVDFLKKL